MDEYQAATLTTRYIALVLTATQCLLLAVGLWMMNRANAGRDRQTMLAERRHNDTMKVHAERHAEAMNAHAEAMKAHEATMKAHEATMKAHEATMKANAERHTEAMRANAERHAEAMKANAERHAETMRGIETLIERTAPNNRAGDPSHSDPKS